MPGPSRAGWTHARNLDLIIKARENFVTIICLPPHTTHKMQPLDKTVMAALKTFYNEEVRIFLRTEKRAVTHYDVCELFGRAYMKVQTAERSIKGFSSTGIYPMRRNIFPDEDFLAEQQKNAVPHVTANVDICQPPIVLPQDIEPIPQIQKKVATRGRKPGRGKIITSTPNKEELEESINSSREKVARRITDEAGPSSVKKPPKRKRKEPSPSTSTSESEVILEDNSSNDDLPLSSIVKNKPAKADDVECIFCEEKFSMSRSKEVWVQCVVCEGWAHEACTSGESEVFVCDYCK